AEEPHHRRERRLQAGLAALPFNGFDEPGLLAADVGARTAIDRHLAVVARLEDVLPHVARATGLRERGVQRPRFGRELPADVDVGTSRADGVGADDRAFDQLVRILRADEAVLERAGLALVGVHAHVLRLVGRLRDEAPLGARREAGAA